MLKKGSFSDGLVVSQSHRDYVVQRTGVGTSKVHCIPAGVTSEEFQVAPTRKDGAWKFVYHGRLDKHRGVLALPMLMQNLVNKGFEVHLTLIGDGDVLDVLQKMAEDQPFLSVISQVPRQDIPTHLEKQHIGLLPMPPSRVWTLASPLKRSEYLAAGLLVYGIDHSGHQIQGDIDAWFKLAPQEDFHEMAGEWVRELSTLTQEELQERSRMARAYAETHCSWETSVLALESVLQ
jgi:glycosyltransferase involved in cell wall biosynthesis